MMKVNINVHYIKQRIELVNCLLLVNLLTLLCIIMHQLKMIQYTGLEEESLWYVYLMNDIGLFQNKYQKKIYII